MLDEGCRANFARRLRKLTSRTVDEAREIPADLCGSRTNEPFDKISQLPELRAYRANFFGENAAQALSLQ